MRDKSTGRLHAQCKECYKVHRANYYTMHYQKYHAEYLLRAKLRREKLRIEYRTNILAYLSDKSCIDCGESDIRVLEFDHIDPSKKLFSISQGVTLGFKWYEIKDELKKCQILCANCHKRRTAQQYKWYKAY